jgi:hypothetical protein
MNLREALDRTLLLMRDEVQANVSDDTLLAALTGTEVALIADEANIASHSAQTAFVTAAFLMARSGHRVHLLCPDIPLAGAEPPLAQGRLITELMRTGADLLPGVGFCADRPSVEIDLAMALGDSKIPVPARRRLRLNAQAWSGQIGPEGENVRWKAGGWPMGGMAAAALAASRSPCVSFATSCATRHASRRCSPICPRWRSRSRRRIRRPALRSAASIA